MTQATHTPGPWQIVGRPFEIPHIQSGLRPIADLLGVKMCPQIEADVHLIAAAPDMLAALQLFIDEYGNGGALDGTEIEAVVLAAIAKAQGESVYLCQGCQRPELDCSAEPCPDVIADREG